jgi:carbonic anhydrase
LRHIHTTGLCTCGSGLAQPLDRRALLRGAVASTAVLSLPLRPALAAKPEYQAMVLSCIDPRTQEPVHRYLAKRGLAGQYSQFIVAGGSIGAVAPKFADWHKAFWDNLAITIELHKIKKVIAINHRDCGAAKVAYGDDSIVPAAKETETHRTVMAEFRRQMKERQPALGLEAGLMALDGSIVMFS